MKNTMLKRLLSFVMVLAMVMSYVVMPVGAAETDGQPECAHEGKTLTETVEATCVADGSNTYYCEACGNDINETVPATGVHTYADGVCSVCKGADPDYVEPDCACTVKCNEQGDMECPVCKDGNYDNCEGEVPEEDEPAVDEAVEAVQKMIDALRTEINEGEEDDAYAAYQAVEAAINGLTVEQQAQLNLDNFNAAARPRVIETDEPEPKLPNAEVKNLGAITIDEYRIYNGSFGNVENDNPIRLQIAMEFIAKDTAEQARENYYGKYTTDFFITISGMANDSFVADDCYLAGNYGTFGWVMIPLDGMTIENEKIYPVITSVGLDFSYVAICDDVQDFKCGIFFSDAVLEDNPDMTVKLELGLSENITAAQAAQFITVGEHYTYDVDDLKGNGGSSEPPAEEGPVVAPDNIVDNIVGGNADESVKETVTEIVNEIKNSAALKDYTPSNVPAGAKLVIELTGMTVAGSETTTVPTRIVYDVAPMQGENKVTPDGEITFRLPVPSAVTEAYAKVYHGQDLMGIYDIETKNGAKYVEISSADFSEYAVEPTNEAAPTYVAMIGDNTYPTLDAALTDAKTMTGDVTVEIYGKVTLKESLTGSYSSINFVGKTENAEIYLDVQGYITAPGKKVAFEDLILSKSAGDFITNAGYMNVAFGVYGAAEVTYTNCNFSNGAYASGVNTKVTFTECTFKKSHHKYPLWAYGSTDILVDNCTFDDNRGIKMFDENKGANNTTVLTVKDCDFTDVTDKPAIVLTYGKSVTLTGENEFSATGVFELDHEGQPDGTTVNANITDIACKNDNYADCGVLVDGKIYTTITSAVSAGAVTNESTVTLMYDSTETVELPEGVTLNKNGYEAANVTVAAPTYVAKIGGKEYSTLEAAINEAGDGDTITLLKDVELTDTLIVDKAGTITIDGDGKKITLADSFTNTNSWGAAIMLGNSNYGDADTASNTVTIKNVTFSGITGNSLIRAQGVTLNIADCTVIDCDSSATDQGMLRIDYTAAIISNTSFTGNDAQKILGHNHNGSGSKSKMTVDNCSFKNNTITGPGVIVLSSDAGCTIKDSEFVGNNVTCTNGATVYMGFTENNVVTGNLFQNNTVTGNTSNGRVAGAVFVGYTNEISGNAFVNNSATNASGSAANNVCVDTIYAGPNYGYELDIDLSDNYWGGGAPAYGEDYTVNSAVADAYSVNSYYTTYEQDTDGNVTLSNSVAMNHVATVNGVRYETLTAAIEAAEPGDTVILLKNVNTTSHTTIDKNIVLDLNEQTITSSSHVLYVYNATAPVTTTIKNGTLTTTGEAIGIYSYGCNTGANTINVEGVTVNSKYFGIYHNGSNYGVDLTVKDSTISDTDDIGTGIFLSAGDNWAEGNKLTVEKSTISGMSAVEVRNTEATITGSTLTATYTGTPELKDAVSGAGAYGYAFALTNNGADGSTKGTLNLSDDNTIKGEVGIKVGGEVVVTNTGDAIAAPAGYAWDEDGKLCKAVAKVGDTEYATLQDAIEAAQPGETITLQDDSAVNGDHTLKADVTIDANGYAITGGPINTEARLEVTDLSNGCTNVVLTNGGSVSFGSNKVTAVEADGEAILTIRGKVYKFSNGTATVAPDGTVVADTDGAAVFVLDDGELTVGKTTYEMVDSGVVKLTTNGSIVMASDYDEDLGYSKIVIGKTIYFLEKDETLTIQANGKVKRGDYLTDGSDRDKLPDYKMIDWTNSPDKITYTQGSFRTLTFRSNGFFSSFDHVEINGRKLDAKYYEAKEGSTIITLKNSYLRKLDADDYELTIVFKDKGEVSHSFTVQKLSLQSIADSLNPSTGDYIMIAVGVMVVAAAALVVILVISKKKKK